MKICHLTIKNFRGVKSASLTLGERAVIIGDNNTGKSTVLEAIDLVLGPDRIKRRPPVDEHDFYEGKYLAVATTSTAEDGSANDNLVEAPRIEIEVTIIGLSAEQQSRFGGHVEWLDEETNQFYTGPNVEGVDQEKIKCALRVSFEGYYNEEEDDFSGETYFTRTKAENDKPVTFTSNDKRLCGFLYLRSIRTGSRALSLEHGSLLDIILRIKELRPKIWEDTITTLEKLDVASKPELGISGVLESINTSLKKYVPREWGTQPRLKVSMLTREHLRKIITAYISTGDNHSAPYFRQGNGTINMLVLAMLSQIAEDKQNVIFAMEEPETAIPPYAQKRIVNEVRNLAAQSIFTSHSPYVLEEFKLEETIVLSRDSQGLLERYPISLPDSIKHKRYRQDFRTKFCEGLLARRVLLAEGATEATTLPSAARRLSELNPAKYTSFEALGICTVDAGGDSQIPVMGKFFKDLSKTVLAACDLQTPTAQKLIEENVDHLFMHNEANIEKLIISQSAAEAKARFCEVVTWPPHLLEKYPDPKNQVDEALKDYFSHNKANWSIADFVSQCNEAEMPSWIKDTCLKVKEIFEPNDSSRTVTEAA